MTLPGTFRKSFWIEVPVKKFVSAEVSEKYRWLA